MGCFFPRYLTYAMQQSKARQHGLGLGRFHPWRLCRYVVEQVERTDFLLPRGSTMEIDVPRIPAELAAFRKMSPRCAAPAATRAADLADAAAVEDGAVRAPPNAMPTRRPASATFRHALPWWPARRP